MGPHFVKSSNTKAGCIQPPQLRNSWDFFDIKQQTSPKSPSFTIHLQPFPISQSLCLNPSFYLQVRPLPIQPPPLGIHWFHPWGSALVHWDPYWPWAADCWACHRWWRAPHRPCPRTPGRRRVEDLGRKITSHRLRKSTKSWYVLHIPKIERFFGGWCARVQKNMGMGTVVGKVTELGLDQINPATCRFGAPTNLIQTPMVARPCLGCALNSVLGWLQPCHDMWMYMRHTPGSCNFKNGLWIDQKNQFGCNSNKQLGSTR